MKKLAGWVFIYNEYTNKWQGAKRENYNLLYNDITNPLVIRANNIEALFELIIKTNGDKQKLKKIVNEKY